jgi:transcriptional regulator with XRE-family HTH domain
MKKFSERFKKLLEDRKIKITELSEKTGVSTRSISRMINNDQSPTADTLEKIILALELTEHEAYTLIVGETEDLDAEIAKLYNKLDDAEKIVIDKMIAKIDDDTKILEILRLASDC